MRRLLVIDANVLAPTEFCDGKVNFTINLRTRNLLKTITGQQECKDCDIGFIMELGECSVQGEDQVISRLADTKPVYMQESVVLAYIGKFFVGFGCSFHWIAYRRGQSIPVITGYRPENIFIITNDLYLIFETEKIGWHSLLSLRVSQINVYDIDDFEKLELDSKSNVRVYLDIDHTTLNNSLSEQLNKTILNRQILMRLWQIQESFPNVEFVLLTARYFSQAENNQASCCSSLRVVDELSKSGIKVKCRIFTGYKKGDDHLIVMRKVNMIVEYERFRPRDNDLILFIDDNPDEIKTARLLAPDLEKLFFTKFCIMAVDIENDVAAETVETIYKHYGLPPEKISALVSSYTGRFPAHTDDTCKALAYLHAQYVTILIHIALNHVGIKKHSINNLITQYATTGPALFSGFAEVKAESSEAKSYCVMGK